VRTLKRRVGGRIRGDRAGSPIEVDQYRMYCETGPVKIRLAARVVPDPDPGPLAREHRPQLPAVPSRFREFVGTVRFSNVTRFWCVQRYWNLHLVELVTQVV